MKVLIWKCCAMGMRNYFPENFPVAQVRLRQVPPVIADWVNSAETLWT